MKVNKEQEDLYKKTMEAAKKELEDMDSQMEQELQKIREKLAQMQESKKYYRQIYEGAAHLLGIEVETDGNGDGDALGEGGKASPLLQIQKNKS
jgi:ABC-type Zn uptake system ZnuABC Zn-binding protein ZnuA